MSRHYYALCQKCGAVLCGGWGMVSRHCGWETKYITDAEARERIEGRPFKGKRRKITAKVANAASRINVTKR